MTPLRSSNRVALSIGAALLLSVSWASEDKVTIALTPQVDSVSHYKMVMETEFQGMQAVLKVDFDWKIKTITDSVVTVAAPWKTVTLNVGDSSPEVPSSDVAMTYSLISGQVKSVKGGLDGIDQARAYLIVHFIPPAAPVAVGEEYKVEPRSDQKVGLPGYTYLGKYLGKTEMEGKPAFKFSAKYSESGADGLEATTEYVVLSDGTVLTANSEFKKLPLPQFGSELTGKLKISRTSS